MDGHSHAMATMKEDAAAKVDAAFLDAKIAARRRPRGFGKQFPEHWSSVVAIGMKLPNLANNLDGWPSG
jgi:hypothetical protein